MKQSLRTWKPTRVLIFWVLFCLVVVFMKFAQNLDISGNYFAPLIGVLLIASRIHSTKERIKRLSYFLSLLALLFLLIVLRQIINSQNFSMTFLIGIASFTISYFFVSSLFVIGYVLKIFNLSQEILGLEIPGIIRTLILSFLLLGVLYPFVVLNLKRLRDINLSGWFSLLTLIPGISLLFEIFLCLKGSAKSSKT